MAQSEYAAARERVLERQRQRATALLAQRRQQHAIPSLSNSSPFNTLIARLPSPLRSSLTSLSANVSLALGREGTNPSFRVGQLDSELLDNELLDLFKNQVSDALKYYTSHLLDDYTSEITLLLRSILFKLTIWNHNASYGAALQNLHYTDARTHSQQSSPTPPSRTQKSLYGLLSIGAPYAWQKWQDRLLDLKDSYDYTDDGMPPRLQLLDRCTSIFTTAHSAAAFASFALFLLNGRYRTLLDRLLRLRLTPKTNQLSREVSFEYLNRQLVWHAFTEFLLFLLPLVGIARWRRWLSKAWQRANALVRRTGSSKDGAAAMKTGELAFLPERTCAICYQDQNPSSGMGESDVAAMSAAAGSGSGVVGSAQTDVTNPYQAVPCGCVYCFVCLAQRLEAEDGGAWICLKCGEGVSACKPWNGDVLETASEPASDRAAQANKDVTTSHPSDLTAEFDDTASTKLEHGSKSPSPSTSPRSSMSRGSKPSSPAKSVSFAEDVVDNERAQAMKDVDPMPVDDEEEAEVEDSSWDGLSHPDEASGVLVHDEHEENDDNDEVMAAQAALLLPAEDADEGGE